MICGYDRICLRSNDLVAVVSGTTFLLFVVEFVGATLIGTGEPKFPW